MQRTVDLVVLLVPPSNQLILFMWRKRCITWKERHFQGNFYLTRNTNAKIKERHSGLIREKFRAIG